MATEKPNEFGDDFPPAPPRVARNLPIATILIAAGLSALIVLLVLAY